MSRRPRAQRRGDVGLAVALGAAVIASLLEWPPTLGYADEAYFLYEAKRLLDGEALYRDVFEIYTPLGLWMVAAAYQLFGTSITVARGFAAAVHAGIAALLFAICRTLGVRRSLAVLTAALAVALAYPLWPIASQHWLAALWILALLLSLLRLRPDAAAIAWLVPGLLLGVLASMQQQKAPPFALAALAVLAFDVGIAATPGRRVRTALGKLTALGLGTFAVLGPVMAIAIGQAGLAAVYRALVEFPLVNYRTRFRAAWGAIPWVPEADYFPKLMRLLPFAPLLVLVPLWRVVPQRRWGGARGPVAVLAFALAGLASIAYFPDLIHYGFITALLLLAPALALEAAVAALAARWPGLARAAVPALAVAVLAWCGVHLRGVAARAQTGAPLRLQTSFGTIAAAPGDLHAQAYEFVQRSVDADPERLLFTAPGLTSFYLLTGGRNPTPYQNVVAGYTTAAQHDEILATLEASRVKTLVIPLLPERIIDPRLAAYVEEHYAAAAGLPPALGVRQRKPGA